MRPRFLPLSPLFALTPFLVAPSLGKGSPQESLDPPALRLTDVTEEAKLDFKHTDGSSGQKYLIETVTCGLALFDYDQDGWVDLYFLNGAPLKGADMTQEPGNGLYRNLGNFQFENVTEKSGLGDKGYGMGVVVGDYDNDGDPDVFLNNFGPNSLYRNNGDGTFTEVTQEAGLHKTSHFGAGASFFDMDGDEDLDLYVANYLNFQYDEHVSSSEKGLHVYSNPRFRPAVPDNLYRNNGDGTFTDVSKESGIGKYAGWGMGTVCCDFDNDGDTDIFVANDVSENFLFQNDGTGKFTQVGVETGVGFDSFGDALGTMGVDCADFDNDGLFDFMVTNYQYQLNCLYRNLGDNFFEDVTYSYGAESESYVNVGWGTSFVDFDNDGFRDIFIANGHLQDNIEKYDDSSTYGQKNLLLWNTGKAKFLDITDKAGSGMKIQLSSRGAAFDDLDNDGDIDVVVTNARTFPSLIRNDTEGDHHWLQLKLRSAEGNRFGVGAHITVKSGERLWVDEVRAGRGYESHYGDRVHFGLGSVDKIEAIEIRWPDGKKQKIENVSVDQLMVIDKAE